MPVVTTDDTAAVEAIGSVLKLKLRNGLIPLIEQETGIASHEIKQIK
jgi:hypothetical protein